MRHLIGLLLSIPVSAALLFGGGWGVAHMAALGQHGLALSNFTGLVALAAVAATGLCAGIGMAVPAISPLATGLPGLALLAWTALAGVNEPAATHWLSLPVLATGSGLRGMLASGVLAVLGAAMIIPLFVPSRWRAGLAGPDAEDSLPEPVGLLRDAE